MLATTGSVSVALVAGCSGGGGTGTAESTEGDAEDPMATDDGGTERDDGGTETDDGGTDSSSPASGTASSTVQQLTIVDHEPDLDYFANDDAFGVELTVENNGEQETDLDSYFHTIVPYDADGNDVSETWTGTSFGDTPATIAPGEQATFVAFSNVNINASEVDRYEVKLTCTGTVTGYGAEGVYCE